eukprot:GEMP01004785.1.p1 GENE.GEMP01004785.1~~GEMP01004785.1.p1  ORF type:complete len:763 (+),score=160.95 GEMP01004785.1:231-2519(+)
MFSIESRVADGGTAIDEAHMKELNQRRASCKNARRSGISAEQLSKFDQMHWAPPSFPKSDEEHASLKYMLRHSKDVKIHVLFGLVPNRAIEQVIDAFEAKNIAQGERVITQDAAGDFFYVVKSGFFEIFVKSGEEGASLHKVGEAGKGFAFGELALLYNAPRRATVTAREESVLWQLDRQSFRMLVVNAQEEKSKEYYKFLTECSIFARLNATEIQQLSELLQEEAFEPEETIVDEGEMDDKFFILRSGSAVACMMTEEGEVEVKHYVPGECFTEIAFLQKEPRRTSVYAREASTCLYIDVDSFSRVLGSLQDVLGGAAENDDCYDHYSEDDGTSDRRFTEDLDDNTDSSEAEHPTALLTKVRPRMKRNRTLSGNSAVGIMEEDEQEEGRKTETTRGQDSRYAPTDNFAVPNSLFHAFFIPTPLQRFTDASSSVVRTNSAQICDTVDGFRTYRYDNPAHHLKASSVCSVLCQKGRKPGSEPILNQDNAFVLTTQNGVDIYGVCDGHGPFGHIVSSRLCQTVPYYLTTNTNFPQDLKSAVSEALAQAQVDLQELATQKNLNFNASGSTCSILMHEGQNIHLSTVGDSKIMVASYNRHDSRLRMISTDHRPDFPTEKARIEATGDPPGEVRDGRVYVKGQNYPGLTMSRAMGDWCCAERGVIQTPDYDCITMQPGEELYAVIASDGLWEFMDGDKVLSLSAKKLRLKGPCETMRFLFDASRKRWKHLEDDYCDDISGILVQWNCRDTSERSPARRSVHIENAST